MEILLPTVDSLQNTSYEKKINTRIESKKKKFYIRADDFLTDIFENLLSNAVKHNQQSEVDLLVKVSEVRENQMNLIKMEFIDNGVGIADDRKASVFKRNFKDSDDVRGFGIGLSLVKKIVDSYGGQIWVEDRIKGDPSKGSNFILLLPEANHH